jgi:branched-chain amino acid transport system substrate-binding protein
MEANMTKDNMDPGKNVVSRREFLVGSSAFIAAVALSACTTKTTTQTLATTTTTATTTAVPKTLKIGAAVPLTSNVGVGINRVLQILSDQDNKNGGLSIGGDRYNIQLITYDGGQDQAAQVAVANRLIFVDKVQYIISDASLLPAWSSSSESNKVIVLGWTNQAMITADPKLRYVFNGSCANPQVTVAMGWFCKNNSEAIKNVAAAYPDNQLGQIFSMAIGGILSSFGANVSPVFFPAETQDFSAVATKIVSMNPSVFVSVTGSDTTDGLIFNTVYQAGFKGQMLGGLATYTTLMQTISPETLEGFICVGMPTEFDPPLTQTAADLMATWGAKYGSWEDPYYFFANNYLCLREALKQAGTTDTDKVAAVLSSGMKFDSWCGGAQMIARPDLGNIRTVDSASPCFIKQIQNGKPKLIATVSIDDTINIFQTANSAPPPGLAPPGGPPPGGGPPPAP